ncbi:MAG: hypothetical protein R3Y27_01525 [Clostridia bacterium]
MKFSVAVDSYSIEIALNCEEIICHSANEKFYKLVLNIDKLSLSHEDQFSLWAKFSFSGILKRAN